MRKALRAAVFGVLALATSGCASSIQQWIVDTRVRQGDVALTRGSVAEAELAYRLALKVDPANMRARAGFSSAAAQVASSEFKAGHFDDALATINGASKYDPQSVRLQSLRDQIEQAKIKREIVVSNYPTYIETGAQIQKSYETLKAANARIIASLKKFDYTYNINELNKAIRDSYELNVDLVKNTNALVRYRQLVEAGVPESQKGAETTLPPPASLLPLP